MSICTQAEAKRNLKSLKRNYPEIDEEDPTQVQTYIFLRRTVSRVFPGPFLTAWKKRRLDVKAGVTFKRSMWLVPRANFPLGLPPALKEAQVSQEQKVAMEQQTGHKIDDSVCFLIDQCVERGLLGMNVEEAVYYIDAGTKFKDVGVPRSVGDESPGDGAGLPAESGVELADGGNKPAGSGAESANSGGPLGGGGAPGGTRAASDLPPTAAAGISTTAANSGAQQLGNGGSEVSSTPPEKLRQSSREAMAHIRTKLEEAFANGHYWSDDSFDFFHGWAWVNNVVTTVEGIGAPKLELLRKVNRKNIDVIKSLATQNKAFKKEITQLKKRLRRQEWVAA